MREHQLGNTDVSKSSYTQPASDEHANEMLVAGANLLTRTLIPAADNSSIQFHASILNRMAASRQTSRAGHSVLELQRRYGNRYVQRVMALARKGDGEAEVAPAVESAIERSRGGGQPLDSGTRVQMESAIGADFSAVRVHTDTEAHSLNEAVNAVAFTTGKEIFFRQGAYDPSSSNGRELLAHELTHVVQQNGRTIQGKLVLGPPGDQYEQEAETVAQHVARMPFTSMHRQCACGGDAISGECESCKQEHEAALQTYSLQRSLSAPLQRRTVCPEGVSEEEGTGCYEIPDDNAANQSVADQTASDPTSNSNKRNNEMPHSELNYSLRTRSDLGILSTRDRFGPDVDNKLHLQRDDPCSGQQSCRPVSDRLLVGNLRSLTRPQVLVGTWVQRQDCEGDDCQSQDQNEDQGRTQADAGGQNASATSSGSANTSSSEGDADSGTGSGIADSLLGTAANVADSVANTVEDVADSTVNTISNLGQNAVDTVTTLVQDVAGSTTSDGADDTGGAASNASDTSAESTRASLQSQLAGVGQRIAGKAYLGLSSSQLGSVNSLIGRAGTIVPGTSLPSLAAADVANPAVTVLPIAIPTITELLKDLGILIAGATLGEILLLAAIIIAIIAIFLDASTQTEPEIKPDPNTDTDNDKKNPPNPDQPVDPIVPPVRCPKTSFRGVRNGKPSPSSFRFDADGLSTFEAQRPGDLCNLPFDFLTTCETPVPSGTQGTLVSPNFSTAPAGTATYTPELGGEGHWSINYGGANGAMPPLLSDWGKPKCKEQVQK